MGPFKLLVSSDLALDTPFWSYNMYNKQSIVKQEKPIYHLSHRYHVVVSTFQETGLQVWNHLKENLEYPMLPPLPSCIKAVSKRQESVEIIVLL